MSSQIVEKLHLGWAQSFEVRGELLVDERSDFQHIQIFDNQAVGRVLVLDDIIQLTERDEATYSEMLVHVPAYATGALKRVMIVGGGDGAVAEEVLKHDSVEVCDLVDIDGRVVELSRRFFPSVHKGAFDDDRLNLHIADAFQFLDDPATAGRYDLIVADRPDPVGPAAVLFETRFYDLVNRALSPNGVAVFQTGVPHMQADELQKTVQQHRECFDRSGVYLTVTPTYIGGFMALTWGSRGFGLDDPALASDIVARFAEHPVPTDYYTPAIHQASFALPRFVAELVEG